MKQLSTRTVAQKYFDSLVEEVKGLRYRYKLTIPMQVSVSP